MDLKLVRLDYFKDGIFGEIRTMNDHKLFATLERAYETTPGKYAPKTAPGTYTCKRGQHRLKSMTSPFETFEIENVKGHTDILFHVGNFNEDSEGCVLIGTDQVKVGKNNMISQSRAAFRRFMDLQKGQDSFTIKIT